MKGKILIALLLTVLLLIGCSEPRYVNCDACGKPQQVGQGSNVDESWIVYCDECYTERFGEDGLISGD